MINLYSVQDLKGDYGAPFTAANDAIALRNFARLVNDPQTIIHDAPQDFRLWLVGTMDADSGVLHPAARILLLADGKDLVRRDG